MARVPDCLQSDADIEYITMKTRWWPHLEVRGMEVPIDDVSVMDDRAGIQNFFLYLHRTHPHYIGANIVFIERPEVDKEKLT